MAENYTYGKYTAGIVGFGLSFYWILQGEAVIKILLLLLVTTVAIFATAYKEKELRKRDKLKKKRAEKS